MFGLASGSSFSPADLAPCPLQRKVGRNLPARPRSGPACEDLDLATVSANTEQISRLSGCLAPIRRRRCKEMGFELVSAFPQGLFVGTDLGEQAAGPSRFLRRHAAVLVEIDGRIGHQCAPLGAWPNCQRNIVAKAEVSAASWERREIPQSTNASPIRRRTSQRQTVLPLRNVRRRMV